MKVARLLQDHPWAMSNQEVDRIVESVWEDRTTFDSITH